MSAIETLRKAESLGVRFSLNGEKVRLLGKASAVDEIGAEVAANKPEILAYLRAAVNDAENVPASCIGSLRDPDGGPYLPWAPYLSPDDVQQKRTELLDAIDRIAALECWPETHRNDVLERAIRGPLIDLLPNLAHFRERLTAARAEAQAREMLECYTWRMEGFDDRRMGR